ncbi:P-loop containing nucleoside triphosphate hydrolase protein [Aspergillus filifer]
MVRSFVACIGCSPRYRSSTSAVGLGSPSRATKLKVREAVVSRDQTLAEFRAKQELFFARISDIIQPLLGDDAPNFRSSNGSSAYAFQLDGVSWLLDLQRNGIGGILADDMGLGKTLQTLSLLQHTKNEIGLDTRFLVVCPLSVLNAWTSEIFRWTTGFNPMVYHGTSEERQSLRTTFRQQAAPPVDIVITSYETLCSDLWLFVRSTWTYVGISKLRAHYKLVLTGYNNLTELWSILHWLYPEIFVPSSAEAFEDAFSLSRGKFESEFLGHVTRFFKIVMLRRTKSSPEVGLNIPPKNETILSVPLTGPQLEWYHRILTGVNQSVLLGDKTIHLSPTGLTPRSQRFVNFTTDDWEGQEEANVKQRSQITTNTLMEPRKFILLRKMVHQFVIQEHKKVIIFSGFDQGLNLCEDLLEMAKEHLPFKHVRLDGSTSSAWRNLSVFLFQNDERYKVFLLSIRAGGEGLNLVSSSTRRLAHRIGQTQPVSIFRIHAKGTVEDQMRRRLAKKAYFADKVLGDLGRDVDHPIELTGNDAQEISLMPGRTIVPSSFHAADLENSDFESILASCALDEMSARDMSLEEKKAWLRRSERVKTNIFNGEKIETKSKAFSDYDEIVLGVSKASRRIGKSRVVMVGEWEVSKESISCASSTTSPTFSSEADVARARKVNCATCFSCHRRRNVLECETCIRSFHAACLETNDDLDYSPREQTIICPHHYCCSCSMIASEAGRLLLSCLNRTIFVGENTDAEARGYYHRNAFFIECANCRDNSGKRGQEELPAFSDKRRHR